MDRTVRGGVFLSKVHVQLGATKVIELCHTALYLCSPSNKIVPGVACVYVTDLDFSRLIWSLRPEATTVMIEFDGSLTGVGVIWYRIIEVREVPVGGCAVDLRGLRFGTDTS